MSKGLRNMSKFERLEAINRRIRGNAQGLGYLAAMDAVEKLQNAASKQVPAQE